MPMQTNDAAFPFLAGGGEMGALMREKDWSSTPLGDPGTWPQTLRTTLSLLLQSRFPMFLWWGEQLTCFYNDAYRPSLGNNGKHPSILGQPAEIAWAEIWSTIQPLIQQVLSGGEAVWSEDQLIPIFRNGQMEDVYWTFSYSAVKDEDNRIVGVLVICTETTGKMHVLKEIREREDQLNFTIAAAELGTWDLNIATGRYTCNARLREWLGVAHEGPIDLTATADRIHPNDRQRITDATLTALRPGSDGNYQEEYTLVNPQTGQERHVLAKGKAVFSDEGVATRFSGTIQDITQQVAARQRSEETEKRFRNIVKQAPLGITLLRGRDFVAEMANETYLQFIDKTEEEFVGRPLFESLPEVKEIVEPLLNAVMDTGVAFTAEELSVVLKRYGKEELGYFNLVYHPLKEDEQITGIMVVATEVTGPVKSKHALAESERQFRNLVMQSPIPMTIFMGENHVVEVANTIMFENIWRKRPEEVLGKPILEVFPELKEQKYTELLHRVYTTGQPHAERESIAYVMGDDGMKKFYLDFEYAPLFDTENNVAGIIVTVSDVTGRKEALLKIEENEKRLNIVIEASELGTWDWNLPTDEISYSQRHLDIFGYKEDPGMSQHARHLAHVHPEDMPKRAKAMELAMKTGVLDYQARIIWPDGSTRWMEARGKVFYDEDGNPIRLMGTTRDITEEKTRQQELRENEARFRLLADSMPQHIWTADPSGILNYFNRSVFDYSGLTEQQILENGWIQIVHPDDREENTKQWMESVSTGKDFLFEHRFRRHDGVYRWQLSRALPQRDAEGNITMWVGTSTDIEDQKMFASELERKVQQRTSELLTLNESLARSEQRYHLMVEEVEDYAILYLNREGIVENWNKGAEKIKGYQADEIVGKSFSIFYPEYERANGLPEKLLQKAFEKGKVHHEGFRVRKDGTLFWAYVAITAVHDKEGNVIGFSKVTHDLTDKKKADDKLKHNAEQLAEKNRALEKMNAELQSFAYVSSHDLQEPLRKIQTFASRILSKEMHTLTDNAKDYFRRMQDAAGRMQILIQDLLAYSRTSATDKVFEKTDLNQIAEEVKLDIKETQSDKQAVIDIGNLGEVRVIPFQFRQLLYNLISNAIKFSKPGITPHVKVESEIVKGANVSTEKLAPQTLYCHISVSDNGIGFDDQYRKRIFEVFQRLHGKDEYSGTGIGLAIVKKIVDNHNGSISATGALNEGARFDIYLPL